MLEIKKDQADKRQFDGLALRNRKPGFIYRWSRRDDFQVALNRFNGYEIVDRGEDKVESILSSGTRMKKGDDVDSTVTLGDLILMSTPEDNYNQRRDREVKTAIHRQIAVTKAYHSEVARIAGQSGVSYESGHYVGTGQTSFESSERQRSDAAERASRRDKMKDEMSEDAYDRMMNELEAQRGGNP